MSDNDHPTTSQIIKPSPYLPWNVEIVAAVPHSIVRLQEGGSGEPKKKKKRPATLALDASHINAGAVAQGWACLGAAKGYLYVWPLSGPNSCSPTGAAASSAAGATFRSPGKRVGGLIDAPKSCVTLFHPMLAGLATSTSSTPPLIALAPVSSEAVIVYACQPLSGDLYSWKVTRDHVRNATLPSHAHAILPLDRPDDDDEDGDGDGNNRNNRVADDQEFVTSLTVMDQHMVVLGTSKGGLICVVQTPVPVSLHATRMMAANYSGGGRLSLMGMFWKRGSDDSNSNHDGSPMLFSVPLKLASYAREDDDETELVAISQHGAISHWKIAPISAHKVLTEAFPLKSLVTLFQENLSPAIDRVDPLEAKMLKNRLHVLVRAADNSECRLYWLRLRIERGDRSNVSIAWVDCENLNRFPAPLDVSVMGLVISQNGVAYAAFHQGVFSSSVTSAVIIMALQSDEDESSESRTIYEVDLPLKPIPALLPGTFSNDVVTHGCCAFARSGLGVRIRVLPPVTDPAAALSPRAAGRANPSAVLKLAGHLRNTFWIAYKQQGKGGSSSMPPSVFDASPVDLEESVLAAATQLHDLRSNDGDGWPTLSTATEANGLEIHLAFIQWLRHGGVYRSLTNYGKWRLLTLGQETAAFIDLVEPSLASTSQWEQEELSKLSLSKGVAPWLKDTLIQVLRDGNMDQYQLWCGWFSTALATATTFREDRISTPYDITPADNPPMVGSMFGNDDDAPTPRVPVWTSHPVLQEVFGLLIEHWQNHPKQKSVYILPPKTVEMIVRVALVSFADSSKSLQTDRAIGKYASIKGMTIPLIRGLHPLPSQTLHPRARSDDALAFHLSIRHEYYEGICQISHDHEYQEDSEQFRLEPLLQSSTECQSTDYETGFTFGQFVLHWQTDHGKFGHTILNGRFCPERDLNHLLQSDKRLHPYRWIQSIHRGDYDGAASSLMEHTSSMTLKQTKFALCMAKLANQVVLLESTSQQAQAEERDKKIDSTLELLGVQKELLEESSGPNKSPSDQHLWSAARLLSLALEKADNATASGDKSPTENATRFCYLGLLISLTMDDKIARQSAAARVWAKSIMVDWGSLWADWIRTEDDLSCEALAQTVIQSTVFGGLLNECGDDPCLSPVTFTPTMERELLDLVGITGSGEDSFRRLLYNVTSAFQESLAAANEDEEMLADEEMVDSTEEENALMVM